MDLDAFEEVDTIWHDGGLDEVARIELHGSFDLLIASHVIEHVPDFVGFLASAGNTPRMIPRSLLGFPTQPD